MMVIGFFVISMLLGGFAIGTVSSTTFWKIPPDALTITRMKVIERRIRIFYGLNHELPQNILKLPYLDGYDNEIIDGWGARIIYKMDKKCNVTLVSLGRDGVLGGEGLDADIIHTFLVELEYSP